MLVLTYRDDGRDALKIYTDPDYFFNLWREAMQKEMREAKEKRREQRKREVCQTLQYLVLKFFFLKTRSKPVYIICFYHTRIFLLYPKY